MQTGLGIRSFAHSLFSLLLKIIHFKGWPWAICSCCSLQKSNRERFACKKWVNRSKNSYFSYVFDSFPLYYAQERIAPATLYKRATMSNLLRLLMTKDWLWAIRSGHSWQKSDRSNSLFFMSELLFRSLKTSKSLEIRWANSQPWLQSSTIINTYYLTLFILNGIVLVYLAPHWSSTLLG